MYANSFYVKRKMSLQDERLAVLHLGGRGRSIFKRRPAEVESDAQSSDDVQCNGRGCVYTSLEKNRIR